MNITITKEVQDFLERIGQSVRVDGQHWIHQPFYFQRVDKDKFNVVGYDQLPQNIKDEIKRVRRGKMAGVGKRKWRNKKPYSS